MSTALHEQHRQWPAPDWPWVMHMTWANLCFLHWAVDATRLVEKIPKGLQLDTHGGQAYLTISPFQMRDTRPRLTPRIPGVSDFLELNVRTYVTDPRAQPPHKPGVYFFSLDCNSSLAVASARAGYHLNYYHAEMQFAQGAQGEWFEFTSERTNRQFEASFAGRYTPRGTPHESKPGSLESFLTDRYCLYTDGPSGELYRAEIDHAPWVLREADAEIRVNTMAAPLGIELPREFQLVQFSELLEVHAWLPEKVRDVA